MSLSLPPTAVISTATAFTVIRSTVALEAVWYSVLIGGQRRIYQEPETNKLVNFSMFRGAEGNSSSCGQCFRLQKLAQLLISFTFENRSDACGCFAIPTHFPVLILN